MTELAQTATSTRTYHSGRACGIYERSFRQRLCEKGEFQTPRFVENPLVPFSPPCVEST